MCDDHQIGEAYRDIVRTYNWPFFMTHLLLEAHGTFGHCHEGHGLYKGHSKFFVTSVTCQIFQETGLALLGGILLR